MENKRRLWLDKVAESFLIKALLFLPVSSQSDCWPCNVIFSSLSKSSSILQ